MSRLPRVLIGVHVHADPAGLLATLESLQLHSPWAEVLLLPDGPDEATRQLLATLGLPRDGTDLPAGPPACLNRLARARADAVAVVLLESGCLVAPQWLEQLLAALASNPAVGIAGPSTNLAWNQQAAFPGALASEQAILQAARAARTRFGTRVESLAPLHHPADFCLAIRAEVLEAVGAADEGYALGPCWEMEYSARALRAGFTSVWACGAYVYRPPFSARRQAEERRAFLASVRRYQDAICGLRLSGRRDGYAAHCSGDGCANFAPPDLMRIHRPLGAPSVPAERAARPPVPGAVPRPAPEPPEARNGTREQPLVSCVMPTRDRADWVLHSIKLLQGQDHEAWELIIVDDGADRLEARLPADPRIRYLAASPGTSIGAKRNHALKAARGEFVIHWDDDDWYAASRLRRQLEPMLSGCADVTGLRGTTFLDLARWEAWRVTPELHRELFVEDVHGGTLAYRRELWERHPFPDTSLAEDAAFLQAAVRSGARLERIDAGGLFVYMRHGSNAWQFEVGGSLAISGWIAAPMPPLPHADRAFLAERSVAGPGRRRPLVSCLMPTANRRVHIQRALDSFARQDYDACELIVLDDGEDRVADLMPQDPRVKYHAIDGPMVLGSKRNVACQLANGDVLLHWDDDDWSAPHRVRQQLTELERSGADVSGASSLLFVDVDRQLAWRYEQARGARPWVAGGTLCFTKDAWRRRPFPAVAVGEDTQFVYAARSVRAITGFDALVAFVHAANTSPKVPHPPWWRPADLSEVVRTMGPQESRRYGVGQPERLHVATESGSLA